MNTFLIVLSKLISKLSQVLNIGNGSTWPGEIALIFNPHIILNILKYSPTEIILVVGTNGKTTTSSILTTILTEANKSVFQNTSGANLLNGIASSILLHATSSAKLTQDYAVFEIDENNLPVILQHITPKTIVVLNLFRDQLDRYGELDGIAKKWSDAFKALPKTTSLLLNADDPLVAYLGLSLSVIARSAMPADRREKTKQSQKNNNILYFGLDNQHPASSALEVRSNIQPLPIPEHASDSIYCLNCGTRLTYKKIFYSHLGVWECPHCHNKRPTPNLTQSIFPLPGTYNKYNVLAAVLAAQTLGINQKIIEESLQKVTPAFGRQEKIVVNGKTVEIFLSKNPISMNESLRTILEISNRAKPVSEHPKKHLKKVQPLQKSTILLVLNDQIPDGRDVSWIWDIDLEAVIGNFKYVVISGDRCWDMTLRIQYSQKDQNTSNTPRVSTEPNLNLAIKKSLELIHSNDTLYILPTYSAMLEVRKILTGRSIL